LDPTEQESPCWYVGAVGDGTTDDSTAILNAIAFVKTNSARGGTIWFGAKTYAVGTTITIGDGGVGSAATYNGIILASMVGVGASSVEFTANTQGTTLKWIGASAGTLVAITGPIVSCGLTNICLDGNALTQNALSMVHSYKGVFNNVLVKNWGRNNSGDIGISLTTRATFGAVTVNGNENTFTGCQVEAAAFSTGTSLSIIGCSRNSFLNCAFAIPGTCTGVSLVSSANGACVANSFITCRLPQQNTGTGTPYSATDTGSTGVTSFPYSFYNDAATPMQNGRFNATAAGGALTVALKTNAGSDPTPTDPVYISFRNVTGTTGDFTVLPITAALSVVAASGSTYGTINAAAFRLWIVGFNDGGTIRLGLFQSVAGLASTAVNQSFSLVNLNDGLATSIQDSGAGSNGGIIYTTGATVTSKPMRILGYLEWSSSGIAAAGTWTTTNVIRNQLFGPGIKKPGDLVQSAYTTTTALNTTTASTTYVSKANTTITPTSAANLLKATWSAIIIAPSNDAGLLSLSRGTTNNTGIFGAVAESAATGTATIGVSTGTIWGYDWPNSAALYTLGLQLKSGSGGTVTLGNGQQSSAEIIEIMT
jgi:hypothetical protein